MTADAIVTISAAVVAVVQLCKWAGLTASFGPIAVLVISAVGEIIFLLGGQSWPLGRTDIWPAFAGWVAISTSAAGVFGFTRAAVGAVTNASAPPVSGAGSSPVALMADPLYVVMHGADHHIAFTTSIAPVVGAEMDAASAQHVDGRPMDGSAPILCDSCGDHLTHAAVVNDEWIAEGGA